jgi:hypothetical protein
MTRSMQSVYCPTCGAIFATQDQLADHQRQAYHGFQCLLCSAEVTTRAQLDAHVTLEHYCPPPVAVPEGPVGAARTVAESPSAAMGRDASRPQGRSLCLSLVCNKRL